MVRGWAIFKGLWRHGTVSIRERVSRVPFLAPLLGVAWWGLLCRVRAPCWPQPPQCGPWPCGCVGTDLVHRWLSNGRSQPSRKSGGSVQLVLRPPVGFLLVGSEWSPLLLVQGTVCGEGREGGGSGEERAGRSPGWRNPLGSLLSAKVAASGGDPRLPTLQAWSAPRNLCPSQGLGLCLWVSRSRRGRPTTGSGVLADRSISWCPRLTWSPTRLAAAQLGARGEPGGHLGTQGWPPSLVVSLRPQERPPHWSVCASEQGTVYNSSCVALARHTWVPLGRSPLPFGLCTA